MGKVILVNWVTLDGVMQAPGRPDEDTRDGFEQYLLMTAPLVLGTGRRLFAGGTQASLRLVETSAMSKGVLIAVYEAARN
jgi:hypothetical protein